MSRVIEVPNLGDLLRRYQSGESELKLSRECGISRRAFRRRLVQSGITPRNGSQANIASMSLATAEQRSARVRAAHEAVKGRVVPMAEREQRAKTRETKGIGVSAVETILADMLRGRDIKVTQQKAIGAYNVDIAIEESRIAIEVFGGGFHLVEHHSALHHKRIPFIRDAGWTVVIIWVDARRYPLGVGGCDYILTLVQKTGTHKSSRGEYHVIRGNGKPVPVLSNEFYCLPLIKGPNPRNSKGRYYSRIWQ